MNTRIDIIQLITVCFSKDYILFIKLSKIYAHELKCKQLEELHINIYWSFVFNNMKLCHIYMITFIKILHFMNY